MHLKKSYLSPVSVTMEIKLDSALLQASDKWCLGLFAGCGDIDPKEKEAISGLIQLTAENFSAKDATMTSVSGTTVQWVDGDNVIINYDTYAISVVGDKAYLDQDNPFHEFNPLHGYYNCDIYSGKLSTRPNVIIPSKYDCAITADGRQVLALPMAAYKCF